MSDKAPRCQAQYKNSTGVVMAGERCRQDAAMEVSIDTVNLPVLLCRRHYSQWCLEPISKVAKWTAVHVKKQTPQEGAGSEGES